MNSWVSPIGVNFCDPGSLVELEVIVTVFVVGSGVDLLYSGSRLLVITFSFLRPAFRFEVSNTPPAFNVFAVIAYF